MIGGVVDDLKHILSLLEASTGHMVAGIDVDMRPRGYDFTDDTYLINMVSDICHHELSAKLHA
jgi:hypothetical protein